jgi:hypothetical protein
LFHSICEFHCKTERRQERMMFAVTTYHSPGVSPVLATSISLHINTYFPLSNVSLLTASLTASLTAALILYHYRLSSSL